MTNPAPDALPADAVVTLREITRENMWPVFDLTVGPEQAQNVAPNIQSIAEAHFSPVAWYRAIYADETPVGFVMLKDDPGKPEYYLWRFMIDARYQGKGFGQRALELIIEYVRTRPGATELLLTFVPGPHSPAGFYRKLGFEETGRQRGAEWEMRLNLKS